MTPLVCELFVSFTPYRMRCQSAHLTNKQTNNKSRAPHPTQSQCDVEDRDVVPPPQLQGGEPQDAPTPMVIYVLTVGVLAEYRQGGLATRLVRNLIAKVEADNLYVEGARCSCIYLHVLTTNTPALRFYEKLGFKRHKLLPGCVTANVGMGHYHC